MKKDYMARLERAARWRLPPREAEEVVADYREMTGDPPRPEEELLRELGKPRDAVRPLVQPRQYYIWLAAFLVMSFCVLTLSFSLFDIRSWLIYFEDYFYGTRDSLSRVVTVLGGATALVWFHWQGRKEAHLPGAIPVLLALLLAWCGGVILYCRMFARDFDGSLDIWGTMPTLVGPNAPQPVSVSLFLPLDMMAYGSLVLSLAGVFWLVKARTGDRRWAAVYILALTAILASLNVVAVVYSMDPTFLTPEEIFRRLLFQSAWITAIGIFGMGVALC